MSFTARIVASLIAVAVVAPAAAQSNGELNLYSSRHYETDERLYSEFEEATGIRINRIEGKADELIARMEAEGRNSPADILLTVDASRIKRAQDKDLFQSLDSDVLSDRIPETLRHPDGLWFGFSSRARIIFYAKDRVENPPQTYAELADPRFDGQVCVRSSTNVYQQSLLAAIMAHEGEDAAKVWAEGLLSNLARAPQGGDTDQLRGIISGECDVAVSNTYYFARAIRRDIDGLSADIDKIGWVFPDQDGHGAHVNISAGGLAKHAPNRDNAVKFLEYLASDAAQKYFSDGNDEYPVVDRIPLASSVASLGDFKADDLPLNLIADNSPAAQQIYNQIGFR